MTGFSLSFSSNNGRVWHCCTRRVASPNWLLWMMRCLPSQRTTSAFSESRTSMIRQASPRYSTGLPTSKRSCCSSFVSIRSASKNGGPKAAAVTETLTGYAPFLAAEPTNRFKLDRPVAH